MQVMESDEVSAGGWWVSNTCPPFDLGFLIGGFNAEDEVR